MIVVKVGGGEGIDYDALCADIADLWRAGQRLVLVHGGSHETNMLAERLGHPPRFVTSPSGYSSRYTDRETLEIFMMAYAGKVNKLIVERLQSLGVNAVGLSGLDGRLLEGKRKAAIRIVEDGKQKVLRDDWTGTIERVNAGLARARAQGKQLGRPRVGAAIESKVRKLRAKQHGIIRIAKSLGIGVGTVQRIVTAA